MGGGGIKNLVKPKTLITDIIHAPIANYRIVVGTYVTVINDFVCQYILLSDESFFNM